MSLFNSECGRGCTFWAVLASAVVGVVTAFLQITGTITVATSFSWVLFGIAVVYLAVALVTASFNDRVVACSCRCPALTALLIGLLGTVLFSLVILAFAFVATSIVGAIILGLLLFFFSLSLTSTACLVSCLWGCGV